MWVRVPLAVRQNDNNIRYYERLKMSNKHYTHLSVIADRSGSMSGLEKDMIGGLEKFFESQSKLDGVCLVDYSQFDTVYEKVFSDRLVASAKPVLEPRGGTALLDALGRNINELSAKFKTLPKYARPSKVIVVVVTDGYENSSKEFTKPQIKELIEKKSKKGWDFVFLGANMDAVAEARTMGFNPGSSLTYNTDNIYAASATMDSYVTRSRTIGNASFTEEERKDAVSTS